MAKRVTKTPYVSLDGGTTDHSEHFDGFTLTRAAGEVVVTTFGDTAVAREPGLLDNTLSLTGLHKDDDAVNTLLFSLVGTKLSWKIQAGNGSAGTTATSTNPIYTGTSVLTSLEVLSGSVGEAARFTLNLPVDGEVTRTTS